MAPRISYETERKILDLASEGHNWTEIARLVRVSRTTVRDYVKETAKKARQPKEKPTRHTVRRVSPDGVIRTVTADTLERAEAICNWRSVGSVAAGIVSQVEENRLGPKREHGTKRTGREGAGNTDAALTETAYSEEASNGC